jgi:elongation factor Ts
MSISAADVKKLRDNTGAGMMECKKALEESNGDFDKAVEILRISGAAKAAKRGAERETSAGIVAQNAGVLVELLCETDFVAKSEDFIKLGDEIAAAVSADLPPAVGVLVSYTGSEETARATGMQIAAMRPTYLTRDEVPAEVVENEKHIALETAKEEGKPEGALEKIVEGRVNGFFKDSCLLEQSSVIDSKKSVKQVLDEAGTTVTSFTRIEIAG